MKSLKLIKKNKSFEERAEKYADRTKENINIDMIHPLKTQINKLDDEIFDLENISLETDKNADQTGLTQTDIENRFKQIIEKNYQKDLLEAKLKSYEKAYNRYFSEEESKSTEDAIV